MEDQKEIQQKYDEYKNYIKSNPVKWVEDFCGFKLSLYQRILLRAYLLKEKLKI